MLPFESRRIYSYTHASLDPFYIRIVVDSASFSARIESADKLSREGRNFSLGAEYSPPPSLQFPSFQVDEANMCASSANLDGTVDKWSTTSGTSKAHADEAGSIEYSGAARESSRASRFTTDALKGICDATEDPPTPVQESDAEETTSYGSANNRKTAAPSSRASDDASLSSASLTASTYSAMLKRRGRAVTMRSRDACNSGSDKDPIFACLSTHLCATRNLTDEEPPENNDAYSPNEDDTFAMAALRSRLRALVRSAVKDPDINDDETFTKLFRAVFAEAPPGDKNAAAFSSAATSNNLPLPLLFAL